MNQHSEQLAVTKLLDELCTRWESNDLQSLRELWDPQDDAPLYQPEEVADPLTTWDQVRDYWTHTAQRNRQFKMRTWDLRIKSLSPDLLSVWYRMAWSGEISGYQARIGGENRVSATLQRTTDGWRFRQLIEAPLAPLLYMKWLYEKAVE